MIDPRHDWRNPNMPVPVTLIDTGETIYVSPEIRSEISQIVLAESFGPYWRIDPTYNLKRRKRI